LTNKNKNKDVPYIAVGIALGVALGALIIWELE
jgi:hypothetical protein